ncbi:MAG: thioredoxin domain-containing protein [Cyanobacteriota bacterium]|nr:thioredoxin domain-containing protein [Cyanobacteriota bacterium]
MKNLTLFSWILMLGTPVVLMGCNTLAQQKPVLDPDLESKVLQIIKNNPQVIFDSLQAYQKEQQDKLKQAQQKILQQMQTNPQSLIGDSPTKGSIDQKIILFEFADFQCPFCQKVSPTVKEFLAKNPEVALVYKHLPLVQIHEQAIPAALASWAAQQQGKFWEYHDALYQNQKDLGEATYLKIAQDLKLDLDKFNKDRASSVAKTAIQNDTELAEKIGLQGTPAFFLNGVSLTGAQPLAAFEAALAQAKQLKPAAKKP